MRWDDDDDDDDQILSWRVLEIDLIFDRYIAQN